MQAEWVIGQYTGKAAERVEIHAESGTGYFIIDSVGRGVNRIVVVAFRRACDSPTPDHLQKVTDPWKIRTWEKRRLERSGSHERIDDSKINNSRVTTISDIFETRKDLN